MKKLASVFALLLLLGGLAALISIGAHAQSGTLGLAACDQSSGRFVACGPVALGANAITLPVSAATANTNIIDTRGVKQATIATTCTQAVTGNLTYYDVDGVTFYQSLQITGTSQFPVASIGSDSAVQSPTPGSGVAVHFPFRAISFNWTNTTATPGTCTARLFLAY